MIQEILRLHRRMVWLAVGLLLFFSGPVLSQETEETNEFLCRQNLGILGDAIFLYLRLHDGRLPGKLSELHTEGLVINLSVFTCPASGNHITDKGQIDQLTDYILVPNDSGAQKVLLLKEKDNFHNGNAHFFFSNWEIKKMPVSSPPGPAPEIQTQVPPQSKPDQPQSRASQPSAKSGSRTGSQSTAAAPVASGGGGGGIGRPASTSPTLLFVFGLGILILLLLIAILLLKNRMSLPAGLSDKGEWDSVSCSKVDLRIEITEPNQAAHYVDFYSAPINIGRDPSNNLVLKDSSVSRHHARIEVKKGKLFLSDLSQGNRTLLDNVQIAHGEVYKNAVIWLGSTCLRVL